MDAKPERKRRNPFKIGGALVLGIGGLVLAACLIPACPKKPKKDLNIPSRKAQDLPPTKKTTTKKPEKKQPRVEPEPYTPASDPEGHRMEMRENEWQAYYTVRSITVAQKQYTQDLKPIAKDLDEDGLGEFCYLLEISGISNIQTVGGKDRGRTVDAADWRWFRAKDKQDKPIFWHYPPGKPEYYWEKQGDYEFLVFRYNQGVCFRINAAGIGEREGYLFIMYLPGKEKAEVASAEVPPGEKALADLRERRFAVYAWPKVLGVTGRRAFFSDRFEAVWACWTLKKKYSGYGKYPLPEAAFDKGGANPGNLEADPGIAFDDSPTLEKVGLPACDGERWKIFGERKGIKRKFERKWSRQEDMEDYKKDGGTQEPWWGE
ncbi:MAG: hypothetical protein ACYTHM_18735 [Planctomycetota bacterium]|jgi:hypothetical protein